MRNSASFDTPHMHRSANRRSSKLTEQHVDFARMLARRLARMLPRHADVDALESDAMLGLVLAARTFDPKRQVAFTTYATPRINGAMLDGLRDRQLCPRGRMPLVMLSLDATRHDLPGQPRSWADRLASADPPVGAALEEQDSFEALIREADPEARKLLREYYFDGQPMTQIARNRGRSASRISQRLTLARQILKSRLVPAENN